MQRLFKTLGWVLTFVVIALLALGAIVLLDRQPQVAEERAITAAERAWARDWLKANRPRDRDAGQRITLTVSEREANLIANELLDKIGQGHARVRLEDGRARIAASLGLPWDPLGSFLNLELVLVEDGHLPRVESARLAGLPLPGAVVEGLADRALAAVDSTQLFEQVDLERDQARITYEWRPDLLERIGSGLISENDLPRVLSYQEYLANKVTAIPKGQPVVLAELLTDLLSKAGSEPTGSDPVAANRAAILVLAAYVNGQDIRDPADSDDMPTPPRRHRVLLRGRQDLGQHFMTSAALAVQGNDTLSSLVGWYKEMSDANGGSGFSFADMAANRAGIRMARLATKSPKGARQVQRIARQGLVEDDFMPRTDGLPEGMNKRAFQIGFGDPNSSNYRRMIAHIDRGIDASRLFRAPPG